jgi:hypothetical protein
LPPTTDGTSPPKGPVTESSSGAAAVRGKDMGALRPVDRTASIAQPARRRRRTAIPLPVKRAVWQRDGGSCSFVDPDSGRRCGSRFLLEIDHIVPYAARGTHDASNLRVYCGAHHRYRHMHGSDRHRFGDVDTQELDPHNRGQRGCRAYQG